MKLKYAFETMELDDKFVAVPVGEGAQDFRAVIRMNSSAAEIFELLKEETSEEAIVSTMVQRHGDDDGQVKKFVHDFIAGLAEEAVVVE